MSRDLKLFKLKIQGKENNSKHNKPKHIESSNNNNNKFFGKI